MAQADQRLTPGLTPSGQSKDIQRNNAKPYAQRPQAPARQQRHPQDENAWEQQQYAAAETASQHHSPLDFLGDLAHPETEAYAHIAGLLAQLPERNRSKIIAVSGNSLIAAGIALALGYHADEKTCLIEIGYAEAADAQLKDMLGQESPIGVSDVFAGKAELDNLIINARIYRPHPNCYVLPHGRLKTDWATHTDKLASLVRAVSKKFHRIILSVPSLNNATAQALAAAGVQYAFSEGDLVNNKAIGTLEQHHCALSLLS